MFVGWQPLGEQTRLPIVVLRIDDIQDFAFRDAQLYILNHSIENDIPLSLSVIPGLFGADEEIVKAVSRAVKKGSEVTVHGFKHEDLTKFSLEEQKHLLQRAKERLMKILGFNASILTPPMLSYNNDTLTAMQLTGFRIISSFVDQGKPRWITEGIEIIPATVSMSNYSNGTWNLKSLEEISKEVTTSIEIYGHAIILTHPQEFMKDGVMNQDALALYDMLTIRLLKHYSLTVIKKLSRQTSCI